MGTLRTLKIAFSFLSDVEKHVDIAHRIITESNRSFEEVHGLTLRASDFRKILSLYNEAGTQAQIDKSVFNDIDVYVGFMHARFGRPVASAKSGAEHEYARAIAAHIEKGRPKYILFGFSDELIRPSKTDGVQMEAVKQFCEEIKEKQKYFMWKTIAQFETRFREQLNELVLTYTKDLNNYVKGGLRYS